MRANIKECLKVFPAPAGLNRRRPWPRVLLTRVPRVCGDESLAGEWSEESSDLNRIMQELRIRLGSMYREQVAREVSGVRKLVDKYFPEEKQKNANSEFLAALQKLYDGLLSGATKANNRVFYDLAANIAVMAARQCKVSPDSLTRHLQATVARYAEIEAGDCLQSSVRQLRELALGEIDPRGALLDRLAQWNATRAEKLSKVAAVHGANWYARECYELSGVQKIKWVTNGSKTCGFCAKLSGKVVGIKEVFAGKGEVFQDGDKASLKTRRKLKHPSLHRGCVCAIVPMQVETIAGVDQGEPMDFERADKGHVNPHYGDGDSGFLDNCQTCVVAYEARCRGYNVEAKSFRGNATMDMLASDQTLAWIDPETGKRPVMTRAGKSAQDVIAFLKERTKPGERYVLSVQLPGMRHIMHVFRETEDINIFDAQSGSTPFAGDEEILELFNVIGVRFKSQPKFMRVDHLQFNKEIVDKILQKATT